jgi:hypothetical protein
MPTEFYELREAWLAVPEPREEAREGARARLFQEIVREQSARLGQVGEPKRERSGLRLRSRFALVLVLVLLLLFVWATLTLAFGWNVVFGNAPRAPHNSKVFEDFNTLDVLAPPGMASGVIANQTRLIATFDGTRLWVAPTKGGGYCFTIGGGGCDALGTSPLGVTYSGSGAGQEGYLPNLREVYGTVNPRWSESVEIRFEDGTVIRPRIVWVSAPIAQGFFYQPIGRGHRRAGHRLREVVALDSHGNIVDVDYGMDRRSYYNGPPQDAVVSKAAELARAETPVGNAVVWRAPSRFDTSCTWLELARRFYYLDTCRVAGYPSTSNGGLVQRGNLVLFYDFGIPNGGSVRLDFADGHHVRLSSNREGFVLYRVVPPAFLASGQPWSYTVIGANGKRLLRSDLSLPSTASSAEEERTVHLPDGQIAFVPRNAIVAKARKLITFRAKEFRGERRPRVTVWVMPLHGGGRCYVYPGGTDCAAPGSHASPLGAQGHGGATFVLLAGLVRKDVATYELRYRDGATERLHPVDGFIMYEIPPSHYAPGHRLELVIARARNGHVLAEQAIADRARGVYPCKRGIHIGGGNTVCP